MEIVTRHLDDVPEEVAWRLGHITDQQLIALGQALRGSGYGNYLMAIVDEADGS